MKVPTRKLRGRSLDYAVALARGQDHEDLVYMMTIYDTHYNYSTSWEKSGPLLEESRGLLCAKAAMLRPWSDGTWGVGTSSGDTALEAFLREYVYLTSGSYVEIPDEVMELNRRSS